MPTGCGSPARRRHRQRVRVETGDEVARSLRPRTTRALVGGQEAARGNRRRSHGTAVTACWSRASIRTSLFAVRGRPRRSRRPWRSGRHVPRDTAFTPEPDPDRRHDAGWSPGRCAATLGPPTDARPRRRRPRPRFRSGAGPTWIVATHLVRSQGRCGRRCPRSGASARPRPAPAAAAPLGRILIRAATRVVASGSMRNNVRRAVAHRPDRALADGEGAAAAGNADAGDHLAAAAAARHRRPASSRERPTRWLPAARLRPSRIDAGDACPEAIAAHPDRRARRARGRMRARPAPAAAKRIGAPDPLARAHGRAGPPSRCPESPAKRKPPAAASQRRLGADVRRDLRPARPSCGSRRATVARSRSASQTLPLGDRRCRPGDPPTSTAPDRHGSPGRFSSTLARVGPGRPRRSPLRRPTPRLRPLGKPERQARPACSVRESRRRSAAGRRLQRPQVLDAAGRERPEQRRRAAGAPRARAAASSRERRSGSGRARGRRRARRTRRAVSPACISCDARPPMRTCGAA